MDVAVLMGVKGCMDGWLDKLVGKVMVRDVAG